MKNLIEKIKQFHNDEQGDIVQYGIIIGILAVISVGALVFLSPKIKQMFDKGGAALDEGNGVSY
jgi:Flp pilus assembly protein, pilin Flp